MYTVYVLQSCRTGAYYIGYTSNLVVRVQRHNSGFVRSTKRAVPWVVIYSETHKTKRFAIRREQLLKSYKGGDAFHRLLRK